MTAADIAFRYRDWQSAGYPHLEPPVTHIANTVGGQRVLCPSQPIGLGTIVLGQVTSEGRLKRFAEISEVPTSLVEPDPSLRLAGPCHQAHCVHWRESCQLAAAIISPTLDSKSPEECPIRQRCRWHLEHGPSACATCDSVVYQVPVNG